MAHALSLYDGTTTISLTGSGVMLSQYVPSTPEVGGNGIVEPVTEPIEVVIYGANTTAMRSVLNSIERMFIDAERRAMTGTGPRVFLQFQPDGDATAWRSELMAGSVTLDRTAMTVFGQAQVKARLLVTRAPYWEGARTQIPLTNGSGTNNTAGLAITNRSTNWVGCTAAQVTGVLPAPLELQMVNTTGAGRNYENFFAAVNSYSTGLAHHIEGETGTDTAGTITSNANCSGSQYLSFTGTTLYATFALSSALLNAAAGRYHRLLARFQVIPSSAPLYCTASVWDYYNLVPLWVGNEIALDFANYFQDFGALPLPPGGYRSSWSQLRLRLSFRSSISQTTGLDYLQFLPADPLCFRHVVQRGMVVANNSVVVDDGIEGQAYMTESGADNPIYAPKGAPLHVWPNRDQRIYILHDGQGMTANWTLNVRAYYRPRRLTL